MADKTATLRVENLTVAVEGKQILNGLSLEVPIGEVHAIMGPNGSGKTTLANTLMGHPRYKVTGGHIYFKGEEITGLSPDKRAKKGLFLAMQYPTAIPGVTMVNFLRAALKNVRGRDVPIREFRTTLLDTMSLLKVDESFARRYVNDGFSGGEKKTRRSPADGHPPSLDGDHGRDRLRPRHRRPAYRRGGHQRLNGPEMGILLITHYQRMLMTVAADGRHSALRAAAGLPSRHTSPPVDVLWFRLSRRPEDPAVLFGRGGAGQFLVFLYRGDYWQVGAAIPKGRLPQLQAQGIAAFRAAISAAAPDFADRLDEIRSWDDVKLLEVRADRLRRWWRPGLLCIGDAAHAMSPVGGIGINFAVQDAVVAANRLTEPLRRGRVSDPDLRSVQRARQLPTVIVQTFQSVAQRGMMLILARSSRPVRAPAILSSCRMSPAFARFRPASSPSGWCPSTSPSRRERHPPGPTGVSAPEGASAARRGTVSFGGPATAPEASDPDGRAYNRNSLLRGESSPASATRKAERPAATAGPQGSATVARRVRQGA